MASESDDDAIEMEEIAVPDCAPRTRTVSMDTLSSLSTVTCHSDSDQMEQNFKDRGVWSGKFDFFFACLGYGAGIANFMRFPGLVLKNGGGVFFIPYVLMVYLCVIPIVYLEMIVGQYNSASTLQFGHIIPLFQGIGWAMFIVTFFSIIYFQVLLSWVVYYLFSSMTSTLPFGNCNNTWNTPACRTVSQWNSSAYERRLMSSSDAVNVTADTARTPSEEYFR